MRTSQYFIPTTKETPADASVISHQLMLRAGMIRKLASGLYTWLPLGLRVLSKVSQIVREEMDKTGALEVLMPAIQPAELWEESGRWNKYGKDLLKIKDRHERAFCFGPTHEEIATDLARREIRSYKQLPLTLYQIQTKFRDEIRPRFGLMRGREFLMKDAYSFSIDASDLENIYKNIGDAYARILDRLGLDYRKVLADTGNIGGRHSHEFQVLADTGEDVIVYSNQGSYAANLEMASALAPQADRPAPGKTMETLDTPGVRTIAALCDTFNIDTNTTLKTLVVKGANDDLVALIVRGDHDAHPLKAEKQPEVATPFELASDEEIRQAIGAGPGSLGPVNLTLTTLVDRDAAVLADFSCGANIDDQHFINANWERDTPLPRVADLREVVEGDPSPDGKGTLQFTRGIEVGHIFQLGDTYSVAMGATVLNENGKSATLEMGCYGFGVSRVVAAAIEQHHDENGIIWPEAMAPFDIVIIPVNGHKSQRVREKSEDMYQRLQASGYAVLLDDRKERPGVLFADADLIGIPHRIIVSERGIDAKTLEYKRRCDAEAQIIEDHQLSEILAA